VGHHEEEAEEREEDIAGDSENVSGGRVRVIFVCLSVRPSVQSVQRRKEANAR